MNDSIGRQENGEKFETTLIPPTTDRPPRVSDDKKSTHTHIGE